MVRLKVFIPMLAGQVLQFARGHGLLGLEARELLAGIRGDGQQISVRLANRVLALLASRTSVESAAIASSKCRNSARSTG